MLGGNLRAIMVSFFQIPCLKEMKKLISVTGIWPIFITSQNNGLLHLMIPDSVPVGVPKKLPI